MSVLDQDYEMRWLSLPRVSDEVDGKRPDHVLQIFGVYTKPILLAIESKERAADLEPKVGTELINYIVHLMDYIPSVERRIKPSIGAWRQAEETVDADGYILVSAAAYLRSTALPPHMVFRDNNCDMLFVMEPIAHGWDVEIITHTHIAETLKSFLKRHIANIGNSPIRIR